MNIYEISKEILSCVDMETGEIIDEKKLESLEMEKSQKIENIALWIKNLRAESAAIKEEISSLHMRQKSKESKAQSLNRYLAEILSGQKFETPRVKCSWRKSVSTYTDDNFIEWAKENAPNLLRFSEPEVDKTALKNALKNDEIIEHARLEEKNNLQIK